MAGLYFHIPFCKRICAYCDFFKSADLRFLEQVTAAMHCELEARSNYLAGERITTRYFGGGTPSLLQPAVLGGLLNHAAELFDCSAVTETTLEANPDDLTPEYLAALRRIGINRLSIGVQSFDDACLKLMNRRHTAQEAITAIRQAQAAGFDNITIDLIFGVPGFCGEKLEPTLDTALSLGVQHISAYHLTVEPNTRFGRMTLAGEFAPVDEQVSEEEFQRVHSRLTAAGFEHYEVSNFAQSGFRAQHNAAYWHGVKYLGIGPAAHSYDGTQRHWNTDSIAEYLAGKAAEGEQLTPRDRLNEYLMTRLRTVEGVDLAELTTRFGENHAAAIATEAQRWVDAGILVEQGTRRAIPPEKMLVSDAVIESLFET